MIKNIPHVIAGKRFLPVAFVIIFAPFLLASCKVYKPAYFFKDIRTDTTISGFVNPDLELKIQKNDVLAISISSLSNEEDILFNKPVSIADTKSGFVVSLDGNIYLHKLGKIPVKGLTRKELKAKLETELLPFLKDPIVTVNFASHRIIVLGETGSQVIDMPEEKMPLLEVLAKSGGATPNAQLSKIMVIRETANTKQVKHLNLEDPSIFTSPWYYLHPNDIVVIKPDEEKINTEQRRTRNQLLYTTVISAITFVFLIVDRIFR
ncbi:MAG: polysaccharide biosynthesis/export family protein [Ferruginibacter sp.]|nr:polysaccharide biosynthesis/export family protein [Ferruginibacter sp.]